MTSWSWVIVGDVCCIVGEFGCFSVCCCCCCSEEFEKFDGGIQRSQRNVDAIFSGSNKLSSDEGNNFLDLFVILWWTDDDDKADFTSKRVEI